MKFKCRACFSQFNLKEGDTSKSPQFCIYCGQDLKTPSSTLKDTTGSGVSGALESVNLVKGHAPDQEKIQFVVGPYQVLRSIGRGGMGEVYLAYDTQCGRRLALKKIREDLLQHKQLFNRFLTEARVTSQLTHPSIIPIYSIHQEGELLYYTMPFVEGETLKEILRTTRRQAKKGEKLHHIGGSIPALIRIFVNICQAIAYAHAKKVLHRDIKPENIIIGKYGEVMILDWGLAKLFSSGPSDPLPVSDEEIHGRLTALGKVVGTVAYMPPERALGIPATVQSDVYSLGVILYQLLTLRSPFHRGTLKEFRQNLHKEKVIDPSEMAPYRDVPRVLGQIAIKCLSPKASERYQTVDDLIREVENYLEGRSEWFKTADLSIANKADWEFQENVLIAEHTAITRHPEISDWVSLMISKESFNENQKVSSMLLLGDTSQGIGFLLGVPEASERVYLNDGYCIWIGSDRKKGIKILRSSVEVLVQDDIFIPRNSWVKIDIEKVEHHIHVYINEVLQCSYLSHLPLLGTHVGLMTRDADYKIKNIFVYVGGHSIMVNCLAVPDAFLANQDYHTALSEYRRIGYSFPGRAEGREAMFRAGVTLLEQAGNSTDSATTDQYYNLALTEFEKLHQTPGAPLEYLGKALVYQALKDYDEEMKCYELAFRRYHNHPLLSVLQEHIIHRTQEIARIDRKGTYQFLLLTVRLLPIMARTNHLVYLLNNLQRHWELLPFVHTLKEATIEIPSTVDDFSIPLAFWLAKPYVFKEIIHDLLHATTPNNERIHDVYFSLLNMGSKELARKLLQALPKHFPNFSTVFLEQALVPVNHSLVEFFQQKNEPLSFTEESVFEHFTAQMLDENKPDILLPLILKKEHSIRTDSELTWTYLLQRDWEKAGEILHNYSLEKLNRESSLLHFLYGVWLSMTEGDEVAKIHFSGVLDWPYPRSWALGSYYLSGHLHDDWEKRAFMWEKKQLYRQLQLYYTVHDNFSRAEEFKKLHQSMSVDFVD